MDSTNTIFVSQRSISCDGGPKIITLKYTLKLTTQTKLNALIVAIYLFIKRNDFVGSD